MLEAALSRGSPGQVPRREHHESPVSWTALLVAYAQRGYVEKAKLGPRLQQCDAKQLWREKAIIFFQGMKQRVVLELDAGINDPCRSKTFCLAISCAQPGSSAPARKEDLRQNALPVNNIQGAYAHHEDVSRTKSLFDAMLSREITSWNIILSIFCATFQLEKST
ncbi:hypothetical protein SELMODRAFT_423383 [Selaginella moellendorffii]|uniref:Uncharacterized protein n=1 Tax=Selaginella moellendorffii TaxID=88036 RepID=D8SLI7_SELML|nr:hypothetical protein SELMODRAFT_423383 [Selaginella moellendorffii]